MEVVKIFTEVYKKHKNEIMRIKDDMSKFEKFISYMNIEDDIKNMDDWN